MKLIGIEVRIDEGHLDLHCFDGIVYLHFDVLGDVAATFTSNIVGGMHDN